MTKCPFCDFMNEDGALFCEQCKSDLSGVPPVAAAEPPMAAIVEESIPLAEVSNEPAAIPLVEESIPVAAVVEEMPVTPPPLPGVAAEPQATPAPAAPAATDAAKLPEGAQPKLVVLRGQRIKAEYPIYEGHNFIGRADEKPVDIDLEDQEPPDRIWCSRQHALLTFEESTLTLEDLNSANGTYVNREKVYPGTRKPLKAGDVIQIGNVQLKVTV